MAALTTINAAPVFKQLYPLNLDKKVMSMGKPILTWLEHRKDLTSLQGIVIPLQWGAPNSRSHDPVISEGNQNPGAYGNFTFKPVPDYLTSSLQGQVVRMAKEGGDRSYFANVLKQEMDTSLDTFGINTAKEAYGSQDGYRGIVSSFSTTSVILTNKADALLWEQGMQAQASVAAGGALLDSGDFVTIDTSNWITGELVATTNWSNIASFANGVYLYQRGDARNGGTAKAMIGLTDAVPTSVTPGENFLGTDRSKNRPHLAGIYMDLSGTDSMSTVFLTANRKTDFARGGGFADATYFVNSDKFAQVQKQYEGSRFIDESNSYQIGIESFRVGNRKIVPDPFCPYDDTILIGKGAFVRATCGDQPSLNNADSLEYRLMPGDVYQFQMVVDGQNVIQRPWGLARFKMPAY